MESRLSQKPAAFWKLIRETKSYFVGRDSASLNTEALQHEATGSGAE